MDTKTIEILLGGGGLVAITVFFKEIIQLFKPKGKIDVQKIQSEIRLNDAEIKEKSDEGERKVSQLALEWTANLSAQLEKAYTAQDVLRVELDRVRILLENSKTQNQKIHFDYAEKIEKLTVQLKEKTSECEKLLLQIKNIKK